MVLTVGSSLRTWRRRGFDVDNGRRLRGVVRQDAQISGFIDTRWSFRKADVRGSRIRVWGHPRVINIGRMLIGPRVRIRSTVATIHSVIGAGSVVTRDVPARTFAAGAPCRVVRSI